MNDTAPLPPSTPADSSVPADGPSSAGPPPDPPVAAPGRLVRPREGRIVGGVCASLAEHFGIDVLLVRVLAVVLAVSGGAGLAAYLAFWLLTPSSDAPAPVESSRPLFAARSGRRRALQAAGIVLLAILVLSAIGHAVELGFFVLVVGALVGVALLTKRWWRVLLALVVLLAVAIGSIAATGRHLGTRDFAVARATDLADSYGAPTGTVRLDLRGLVLDRSRSTTVWVGSGDVVLTVPASLPVHVDAQGGVGTVTVFGRSSSGPGAAVVGDSGPTDPALPRLAIDAVAGTGRVTVVTAV